MINLYNKNKVNTKLQSILDILKYDIQTFGVLLIF